VQDTAKLTSPVAPKTDSFSIERVQSLRRLTRAVSDVLREQVSGYLATLAPLFRPRRVLGQYVQGSEKEPVRGADSAFRDLQGLYESVARAAPFSLARGEVKSPIDVSSGTLALHPMEYSYEIQTGGERRAITVRAPLSWALSYSGYAPSALAELLAQRTGANEHIHQWLLHQLVLQSVVSNQPGLTDILGRLHFPVSFVTEPASGLVPLTRVGSPISTVRPPDDVIIQSVELGGIDAFEEIVNVADIVRMDDPLKERLVSLARSHGETL
jgi:hypothetical protein